MKINQLFTQHVDQDLVLRMLKCFGLNNFEDKRTFCKHDLTKIDTVKKLEPLIEELRSYYLPCKAKVYLDNMDVRKAITVMKQVLRLHNYYLQSKEKNFNTKKVMFYTLITEEDKHQVNYMRKIPVDMVLTFN